MFARATWLTLSVFVALHAAALVAVLRLSDDEQERGDEPYSKPGKGYAG